MTLQIGAILENRLSYRAVIMTMLLTVLVTVDKVLTKLHFETKSVVEKHFCLNTVPVDEEVGKKILG